MFGAFLSNAVTYLINETLPMILEINNLRDSMPLSQLALTSTTAVKESVRNLTEIIGSSLKEQTAQI